MREIEFRGKRPDNGEWVYGSGYLADNGTIGYPASIYSDKHGEWRKICGETLGQYTGLKDKNGEKIFDGDILHDEDRTCGIVEFSKGRFVGNFDGRTYYYELYLDAEKSEVIGNIHDNPELLEASNG